LAEDPHDPDVDPLFAHALAGDPRFVPLAERMRPRSLDEVVGQRHLLDEGRLLRRVAATKRLPSLILWGPPGVGKTTLARLLVAAVDGRFESLSATSAGVADLRRAVTEARRRLHHEGRQVALFVDEIHRFNKAQQDALLPHVEAGVLRLIGATTENPGFEVNAALLSRMRVVQLRPLGPPELGELLARALSDPERGLGEREVVAERGLLEALARAVDGDARRALNTLEIAVDLLGDGERELTPEAVATALGGRRLAHDKDGEAHFDLASALIKSMRASAPDAAVYWLARLLEAGEDPVFVARRLVIFAAEDIGNAAPMALVVAEAAARAAHLVGMPEARLPLTQAALHLALAPKSNTTLTAYEAAKAAIRRTGALPVPLHLRNAPTSLARGLGAGVGYVYPHDLPEGVEGDEAHPLPGALREAVATLPARSSVEPQRRFVRSSPRGWEADAERALAGRRARAAGHDAAPDPVDPSSLRSTGSPKPGGSPESGASPESGGSPKSGTSPEAGGSPGFGTSPEAGDAPGA
jgi:putative ATPase